MNCFYVFKNSSETSLNQVLHLIWGAPLEQFEVFSAGVFENSFSLLTQVLFSQFIFFILPCTVFVLRPVLVPMSWLSLLTETLLTETLNKFFQQNATISHQGYFLFMTEFTLLLLIFNLTGLFPYGFTVTAQMVVTFFFGFLFFFGLNLVALRRHGYSYWSLFLPSGTPFALSFLLVSLELISYYSRVVSISVRLFANMMAGHALMKILASFTFKGLNAGGFSTLASLLGLVVVFAILGLEFGVALLQVFVFLTLMGLYFQDVSSTTH